MASVFLILQKRAIEDVEESIDGVAVAVAEDSLLCSLYHNFFPCFLYHDAALVASLGHPHSPRSSAFLASAAATRGHRRDSMPKWVRRFPTFDP